MNVNLIAAFVSFILVSLSIGCAPNCPATLVRDVETLNKMPTSTKEEAQKAADYCDNLVIEHKEHDACSYKAIIFRGSPTTGEEKREFKLADTKKRCAELRGK